MDDVGKFRTYHDLVERFNIPPDHMEALESQLEDRELLQRFRSGFQVESWFQSIFSVLPWSDLIHGLDQEQRPARSKADFQVPDFLAIVETSALSQKPLLIEVKRRKGAKQSLRVRSSQVRLTRAYADRLGLPLVYATYWDLYNAWTINTPDTFEDRGSSHKLTLSTAVEFDCSLVFGDMTFLVLDSMKRVQEWDKSIASDAAVHHHRYGVLVRDCVTFREKEFLLTPVESAAIDSMCNWRDVEVVEDGTRSTVRLAREGPEAVRFSTWITRNLARYRMLPSEREGNVSAHIICNLRDRMELGHWFIFPWGEQGEISALQNAFLDKGDDSPAA